MAKEREKHYVRQRKVSLRHHQWKRQLRARPSFRRLGASETTAKARDVAKDIQRWTSSLVHSGLVRTQGSRRQLRRRTYEEVGDSSFYTQDGLQQRMLLRGSPVVAGAINRMWAVLPKERHTRARVSQATYVAAFGLLARDVFEHVVTEEQLRAEWAYDNAASGGAAGTMPRAAFFEAAFDLIDTWCDTADEADYADTAALCARALHASTLAGGWRVRVRGEGGGPWTQLPLRQVCTLSAAAEAGAPCAAVTLDGVGPVEADLLRGKWYSVDGRLDGQFTLATDEAAAAAGGGGGGGDDGRTAGAHAPPAGEGGERTPCDVSAVCAAGITAARLRYESTRVASTGLLPMHFDESLLCEGADDDDDDDGSGGGDAAAAAVASLGAAAAPLLLKNGPAAAAVAVSPSPPPLTPQDAQPPQPQPPQRLSHRWLGRDPTRMCEPPKKKTAEEVARERVMRLPPELRRLCKKLHSGWAELTWARRLAFACRYRAAYDSEKADAVAASAAPPSERQVPPLGEVHALFTSVPQLATAPPPLSRVWSAADCRALLEAPPLAAAKPPAAAAAAATPRKRPAGPQRSIEVCTAMREQVERSLHGTFVHCTFAPDDRPTHDAAVAAALCAAAAARVLRAFRLPVEMLRPSFHARKHVRLSTKRVLVAPVQPDERIQPYWDLLGKEPPVDTVMLNPSVLDDSELPFLRHTLSAAAPPALPPPPRRRRRSTSDAAAAPAAAVPAAAVPAGEGGAAEAGGTTTTTLVLAAQRPTPTPPPKAASAAVAGWQQRASRPATQQNCRILWGSR